MVLGTAFIVGGMKFETQTYNKTAANTNSLLMMVSVTCILIPSILNAAGDVEDQVNGILNLSRATSVLLVIAYLLFLYFQLKTHSR